MEPNQHGYCVIENEISIEIMSYNLNILLKQNNSMIRLMIVLWFTVIMTGYQIYSGHVRNLNNHFVLIVYGDPMVEKHQSMIGLNGLSELLLGKIGWKNEESISISILM
ncbi:hypothetical protein DERF_006931 [Dermatophagoides farinae]|uniref:Uncharacterized protein n=1 Tax=Dermatophagoides farinae TaxID=6954 RepID=A0A922HX54_DERFA|nr:hypothetical protein DERF_006931 [Dermatophagoides farinae]